jgi:hypothetical protein
MAPAVNPGIQSRSLRFSADASAIRRRNWSLVGSVLACLGTPPRFSPSVASRCKAPLRICRATLTGTLCENAMDAVEPDAVKID